MNTQMTPPNAEEVILESIKDSILRPARSMEQAAENILAALKAANLEIVPVPWDRADHVTDAHKKMAPGVGTQGPKGDAPDAEAELAEFNSWIARTKCFAKWTRRDIAREAWMYRAGQALGV